MPTAVVPRGDAITPSDLFVFAGAGVSFPPPTALPVFDQIRVAVLRSLGLSDYLPPEVAAAMTTFETVGARAPEAVGADVVTAMPPEAMARLAPELFLNAVHRAGLPIESWLGEALGVLAPNAAHRTLARLARDGAAVWTVNFDRNIEGASDTPLSVCAWPAPPVPADITKPHGSVGGPLIATAEQVTTGLDPSWLEGLEAELAGRRVVVFVGYSGHDLDFHPHWQRLLRDVETVVWFDFQGNETHFKEHVTGRSQADGSLVLPDPHPPPPGVAGEPGQNPAWDFVAWCAENAITLPEVDELTLQLFETRETRPSPRLVGDVTWAAPALLGLLGAYDAERHQYLRLLLNPRHTLGATQALGNHYMNHGGRPVGFALTVVQHLLPDLGPSAGWKERALRKRLTVHNRLGEHEKTLRLTEDLPSDAVSTYLILRSQAMRIAGSLEEAAALAQRAYEQAQTEAHPVRVAHAAYQRCQALVWAGRHPEALVSLHEQLAPHAQLAAARWVAWAKYIEASLLSADPARHANAAAAFDDAESRFAAECLWDGVVSCRVAALTLHRRDGDAAFRSAVRQVETMMDNRSAGQRYYTRGSTLTSELVDVQVVDHRRVGGTIDPYDQTLFRLVASRHPLINALALLEAAMLSPHETTIRTARSAGAAIGQSTVLNRCDQLTGGDPEGTAELLFC